jgi:hypothetical protein
VASFVAIGDEKTVIFHVVDCVLQELKAEVKGVFKRQFGGPARL